MSFLGWEWTVYTTSLEELSMRGSAPSKPGSLISSELWSGSPSWPSSVIIASAISARGLSNSSPRQTVSSSTADSSSETLWPLRCLNPAQVVIPQILLLTSRISPGFTFSQWHSSTFLPLNFFLCFLSTGPVLVSGSAETILGFSTALHPQQVRDSLGVKFSHSPYRIQVSGDTQVLFPPPGKEQKSTCHQVCSFPPSPEFLISTWFPTAKVWCFTCLSYKGLFSTKCLDSFSCQLICSLQLWFPFFHIMSMDTSSFSIRRSPETHIHMQTSFSSKQKIIRWVPGCFVP